jgi:hypothetical protein
VCLSYLLNLQSVAMVDALHNGSEIFGMEDMTTGAVEGLVREELRATTDGQG